MDHKATIEERLRQRENNRLAALERKKTEKESTSLASEQASVFSKNFNDLKTKIENKLVACKAIKKEELVDYFDKISTDLQKLQKYVSDSSLFLPLYDVRVSSEALKQLNESFTDCQQTLLPKKKFAFKIRKKENTAAKDASAARVDEVDSYVRSSDIYCFGFKNESNQTLFKTSEELLDKNIDLTDLNDCKVSLLGNPNTLHMSGLKHCEVIVGPVSTSVFIEDCSFCLFVVACQQLRVHLTHDSDFFLHATSTPIIEDCDKLRFAPYNLHYEDLEKQFSEANLDRSTNYWDDVNDFNWLATDQASPHWTVIPTEERTIIRKE